MASIFDFADSWNDAGTTFSAIRVNVTDSASAADSKLINLLVGAASKFSVDKDGDGVLAGGLTVSGAAATGNLSVTGSVTTTGGITTAALTTTADTSNLNTIGRYSAGAPYSYLVAGTGSSGFRFRVGSDVADITSTGLSVTGLITSTAGIKETGAVLARFENTGGAAPSGATGMGLELAGNNGLAGYSLVRSFNRSTGLYTTLKLDGSVVTTQISGIDVVDVTSTGLSVTGTGTFSGWLKTTKTFEATVASLSLGGPGGNWIGFEAAGVGAPTLTTRSAGTKIVLYPAVGPAAVDYALGVDSSTFWLSAPDTAHTFKWYGGTTLAASLTGTGNLDVTGTGTFGGNTNITGGSHLRQTNGTATMTHYWSGTNFYSEVYDTTGPTYRPWTLRTSFLDIEISGTRRGFFDSTGLSVTGDLTATNTAGSNIEHLTLVGAYSANQRKAITWKDATSPLGKISVHYDGASESLMIFGHLYNAGYATADQMTLSPRGLDVVGEVQCDNLRIDKAPVAETITATHTLTINVNGANYKIPIVAA